MLPVGESVGETGSIDTTGTTGDETGTGVDTETGDNNGTSDDVDTRDGLLKVTGTCDSGSGCKNGLSDREWADGFLSRLIRRHGYGWRYIW